MNQPTGEPLVILQLREITNRLDAVEQLRNVRLLTPFLELVLEDAALQALGVTNG